MTDDLQALRALRPRPRLDDAWAPGQQTALLERIMLDSRPDAPAAPRRSARRAGAVLTALALTAVAAPGIAHAVGGGSITRQSFAAAYAFLGADGDDPRRQAPRRVASVPGPYGGTLTVVEGQDDRGRTCLAPVFETTASRGSALPDEFEGLFSMCDGVPSTRPFGPNGLEYNGAVASWWADAGDAVRGELTMPDGTTYPVAHAQGYLIGWHPTDGLADGERPVLTGYAADGTVVGKTPV